MKINSGHLEKLEALAATGMPGAYKVLIFFLIQQVYGLDVLGNIASWQSIAQILGFFTAIGWSSLVLVRVAKAKTKNDRVETFNRLAMMGGVTLLVSIIGAILCGVLFDKIEDAIQISYWLAAWTLYQIPRHYLIALKMYRNALYLDAVVIGFSFCSLAVVSAEYASLWLALSMLAGGVATLCLIQKGSKVSFPELSYEKKGLEFGLVNFLSGGIALSLVPLASYLNGEEIAGAISLFISIAAIALLVPRAISLNQLPTLAKAIDIHLLTPAPHLALMRRQISLSNFFASLFCLVVGAFMLWKLPVALSIAQLMPIFVLLTLQQSLSTQALVDSNIMMVMEKSEYLLKINAFSFVFFFLALVIILPCVAKNAFLYICFVVVLINCYRLGKGISYVRLIRDNCKVL